MNKENAIPSGIDREMIAVSDKENDPQMLRGIYPITLKPKEKCTFDTAVDRKGMLHYKAGE